MSKGEKIRDEVIFKTLHEELVGPCAYGEEIDIVDSNQIPIDTFNSSFVTKDTKEEILKTYPIQRYGVAVIYPIDAFHDTLVEDKVETEVADDVALDDPEQSLEFNGTSKATRDEVDSSDDFDISLTNARAPSSVGLSFLFDQSLTGRLTFEVGGAFYKPIKKGSSKGSTNFEQTWWYRKPFKLSFEKHITDLTSSFKLRMPQEVAQLPDEMLVEFTLEGVVREYKGKLLMTVALVNRHETSSFLERNEKSLFQTQLKIRTPDITPAILPYPEPITNNSDDVSNQLLYRNAPVFGRGHGVACNWNAPAYKNCEAVSELFTDTLPSFETPSISAEIKLSNGEHLSISMEAMSEFEKGGNGDEQILTMLESYRCWYEELSGQVEEIRNPELESQAKKHIAKCKEAHQRMSNGYELICTNTQVKYAFQLANKAMLEQQKHTPNKVRPLTFDDHGHPFTANPFVENFDAKGIWRPFQIGFLLMCLQGAADKNNVDHEVVDLIWFPTGGGKTEAYLGLAAFTLIYERLCNGEHSDGVQVLMRYTLRLLTAQQLQRAATLICCLEVIRQEEKLAGKEFSIGLWVGGKNTPNTREKARHDLKKLKENVQRNRNYDNPFLLDRCPYCAAEMGVVKTNGSRATVVGYRAIESTGSVIFSCTDSNCIFHKKIPVVVIDEDIYAYRPSLVIGTVDKFAMLAWQPKIRSLFGINIDGARDHSPPALIIQDELHLISGPLGSMVALYEPLIEKLCSEKVDGKNVRAKIVCATATTKGYQEQILGIYGREKVDIFPPPGLHAEDSFFAKYARDNAGELLPGRKYVGVCAPGLGSILSAQVRTHAALLFAANRVEIEDRDPWVTLLSFYNSIRELGGALTLFQSDIISYLLEQKRRYPRWLLPRRSIRGMELTSRLKDDEIPKSIAELERSIDKACLNTNLFSKVEQELTRMESAYPELLTECTHIKKSIQHTNRMVLEDYHSLEKISNFLRNRKPSVKMPAACKKLYNLCLNYEVQAFCLASSIIEVGIDIDRLSLMSIVGQPKTTAQYIQVSGRVGRRSGERPGLVVTIYNNAKPRDKSHYEDFRGYHQRLYAKVEPASVTPFSRPALKRGLFAITVANARQFSRIDAKPSEIDPSMMEDWVTEFKSLRRSSINSDEMSDIDDMLGSLVAGWSKRARAYDNWGQLKPDSEPQQNDLLFPLGATGNTINKLPCPTSMRNVDGESSMWITDVYSDYDFGDWDD